MVEAPKIGVEADALKSIRDPLISSSPVKYLPSRMTENDPEAYAYSLRIPPNTPVMLGNAPTSLVLQDALPREEKKQGLFTKAGLV